MSILSDALAALHRPKAPLLHVAVDEGSGPPVILVHGIASSSATFHYVIPLIEAGHRVIAIDILGFGESPRPPDAEYTMHEHVDALAATIHSLHLREPFVLVGHSLGCLITSRFASTHAKVVTHLVLVSPPIYLNPMEIGDPKLRKRVSGYLKIYDYLLVPFVKSMQHCIEVQTIISDLAHVEVPIDVVYGRFDEFIAPGSIAIIEKMRGVTVHMVQAADHMIRMPLARVVAAAINTAPASLVVT
ncbi:MAG: alpha/beta hydrolase [Subtercola sp.]|nr:alpha/beta hydrolase [Subtercola sp.]